jgi:hypothetical protein
MTDLFDSVGAPKRMTAEELFGFQCRARKLPAVFSQLQFAMRSLGRRWKFDWAFPDFMVAVEIEGLTVAPRCRRCYPNELVVLGRHASITGLKNDMVKYNTAALLGWVVLRFEPKDVPTKRAIDMTMRVLVSRGWCALSGTQ